jgi:hypothetical protein
MGGFSALQAAPVALGLLLTGLGAGEAGKVVRLREKTGEAPPQDRSRPLTGRTSPARQTGPAAIGGVELRFILGSRLRTTFLKFDVLTSALAGGRGREAPFLLARARGWLACWFQQWLGKG